jgi:hypothetical protein
MNPPIEPIDASDINLDASRYFGQTLALIWEGLATWLGGALMLGIAALPALFLWLSSDFLLPPLVAAWLAVGPMWTGLCYVVARQALQYPVPLTHVLRAAARYYWRSLLLGLPLMLVLLLLLTTLPVLASEPPLIVSVGIGFQLVTFVVLCLLGVFAFPLLAVFDLTLRQAWVNSLVLFVRWPAAAIGLLGLLGLLVVAGLWFGAVAWLLTPILFGPFAVTASLILAKRAAAPSP